MRRPREIQIIHVDLIRPGKMMRLSRKKMPEKSRREKKALLLEVLFRDKSKKIKKISMNRKRPGGGKKTYVVINIEPVVLSALVNEIIQR